MKLRRASASLLLTCVFLLELSVITASAELLNVALLPALMLATSLAPFSFRVVGFDVTGGNRVGERVEVTVKIRFTGFGIAKVLHELPESFELVGGSNARGAAVVGSRTVTLQYTCVPLKRGVYELGKLTVELEDFLAASRRRKELRLECRMEVRERIYRIKRLELRRSKARELADIDVFRLGPPGTDFKEIRKYSYGDPLKFVNWKATSKLGELMVNEFEREGKKSVWIFLDSNPYMLHGKMGSCFETAIEVAASLAYYFTTRGYRTGFYAVGWRKPIYPESGERQFRKIHSTLVRLEVARVAESFREAVERVKKFVDVSKPALIFVTRAEFCDVGAIAGRSATVIAVYARGEGLADTVEEAVRRIATEKLRKLGVRVVEVEAGRVNLARLT
ncbi:MAG: DUF58 domain-containing protein [Archaeoglobaceae archaeon]